MITSSKFAMHDQLLRAAAVNALEAHGYRCTITDDNDQWLLKVLHPSPDWATVRWTVLRADPDARSVAS